MRSDPCAYLAYSRFLGKSIGRIKCGEDEMRPRHPGSARGCRSCKRKLHKQTSGRPSLLQSTSTKAATNHENILSRVGKGLTPALGVGRKKCEV